MEKKLEDFSWEGRDSRVFELEKNAEKYCYLKFCHPPIKSDCFEFTIKLIDISSPKGGFQIGISDKNNIKKDDNDYVYFGSHGWGYGWYHGSKTIHYFEKSKHEDFTSETYGKGDEVTVRMNKKEKRIEFLKNAKSMGKVSIESEIPKELVIALTLFYQVKVELVHFKEL